MRSSFSMVIEWYQTPSGYTTTVGPDLADAQAVGLGAVDAALARMAVAQFGQPLFQVLPAVGPGAVAVALGLGGRGAEKDVALYRSVGRICGVLAHVRPASVGRVGDG